MTDEELKRARWVDRGLSLIMVIVGVVGTSWAAGITDFKKQLDTKADKEYVQEQIKHHEDKQEQVIIRIEEIFKLSLDNQEKTLTSINERLRTLENKTP